MVTKYGMSGKVGAVSLDYDDDGRSMSSETRAVVEGEVRALVQVRGGLGGRRLRGGPFFVGAQQLRRSACVPVLGRRGMGGGVGWGPPPLPP